MLGGVSTTTPDPRLGALVAEAEAIESWSTDNRYWDIVDTLVGLPIVDGFGLTQQLCASDAASLRRLGAHLIAEMATRGLRRHGRIADDAVDELLLLTSPDEDDAVLSCAIEAAASLGGRSLRRAVLGNLRHPSARVRVSVAVSLPALSGGKDDNEVIRALIVLTQDRVDAVRDFATFSLGSQSDTDNPAVRDALRQRLDDDDASTRTEALIGLARRSDPRAFAIVAGELSSGRRSEDLLEAAFELRDPTLIPLLTAIRSEQSTVADPALVALVDRTIAAAQGTHHDERSRKHPAVRHLTGARRQIGR